MDASHELPSLAVAPADVNPAAALSVDPTTFQDIDELGSDSLDSDAEPEDGEQWHSALEEARSAWDPQEAEAIVADLKEIGMSRWIRKYLLEREVPVRKLLFALGVVIAPDADDDADNHEAIVRVLKAAITRVLRRRDKLESVNTPDEVVQLIRRSRKILVLTGAGISTSCGIPDFRGRDGIYSRIAATDGFELSDPQEMFDIDVFRERPDIFYSFAKELYPSNYEPSASHRFLKLLEDQGKLLRNYTQNIDTLEHQAGVRKVLHCHGSFATATCIKCGHRVAGDSIKDDIFASRVPMCSVCTAPPLSAATSAAELAIAITQNATSSSLPDMPPSAAPAAHPAKRRRIDDNNDDEDEEEDGHEALSEWHGKPVVKPDIVFFGEKLDDLFDRSLLSDRDQVDLLLVMGSSLRVAPVADVTGHLPHSIPQVLINRDPISHVGFDVQLLGDCDVVVRWLCDKLSALEPQASPRWTVDAAESLDEVSIPTDPAPPDQVADSHVWLFEGANRSAPFLRRFEPPSPVENGTEPDAAATDDKPASSIAVPETIPLAGREDGGDDDSHIDKRPKLDPDTAVPS